MDRRNLAVTSAMTAFHIATQSRFPEQLVQRMIMLRILDQLSVEFQRESLSYG
jgi:hypothetical protein